jgi:hypothetical protein
MAAKEVSSGYDWLKNRKQPKPNTCDTSNHGSDFQAAGGDFAGGGASGSWDNNSDSPPPPDNAAPNEITNEIVQHAIIESLDQPPRQR